MQARGYTGQLPMEIPAIPGHTDRWALVVTISLVVLGQVLHPLLPS